MDHITYMSNSLIFHSISCPNVFNLRMSHAKMLLRYRCFRYSAQVRGFPAAASFPTLRRDISLSAVHEKGHSHWQNTKDVKAKNDVAKGKALSDTYIKMKRAVKDGFDPKTNKKLQDIMSEMRKQSLPLDKFRTYLEKLKQGADSSTDGDEQNEK